MQRRQFLKIAAITSCIAGVLRYRDSVARSYAGKVLRAYARVRPGEAEWPADADWDELRREVGGRLIQPLSPFAHCDLEPPGAGCSEALARVKNPFYLGDQPALTQTSGWVDAWISSPSIYAVVAETTSDVVAAVNFARERRLRLVVKGGGHSYQGTSCAPDSLLVWTRRMNDVVSHDSFVPRGCTAAPAPAVTLGSGALWIDAYDAVTTRGGRYVQGGGCTTVGVAGLVQSGGFGSFSKGFGTAAAGLLEAEIVTADGKVRIANACSHPDLFWALKGGGGGTLGVVTQLTLRTRELPEYVGGVSGSITASTDETYRALIDKMLGFYRSALFNPHWGEQLIFRQDNTLRIAMVFQGLNPREAEAAWAPILAWARAQPGLAVSGDISVKSLPARQYWNADFFRQHAPAFVIQDDRPDAPASHILWAGDQGQVGQFIKGYRSAWLPASLLAGGRRSQLVDALFAATRHWQVSLHLNKGLAGAPPDELAAVRNTAMNPQVLDAFALAILGSEGPPAFAGMPGRGPDLASARADAGQIGKAMTELLRVAPGAGSYVSESDYFEPRWQTSFWGRHYARLAAVKRQYDPSGLFFVHHGVGSEAWAADGFERR